MTYIITNTLFFTILNYCLFKFFTNNETSHKKLIYLISLFFIIVLIGKFYNIFYVKSFMMNKKTFVIMLIFSLGIGILSLINKRNNSALSERFKNENFSNYFEESDNNIYSVVLTLIITLFQLLIVWNNFQFPTD